MAAKRAPSAADGGPSHDGSLLLAMVRLADLAARPFQEGIGRRHGLGLSEWRVLVALDARPGCTATDVARRTGLDKMSVSRALASLEAAGRVARRPDPEDGRRALAALTPAGRQLCRTLRSQAKVREALVTAPLSDTERRRLAAMLARMAGAVLDGAGSDPAGR